MPRKKRVLPNSQPPAENPYERVNRLSKRTYQHDFKFDSPFMWGNPFSVEVYADDTADLLNQVTREQFFKAYRHWLRELKRANLSVFKLAEIIQEARYARNQHLDIATHLVNCYQVPPATVRRWLLLVSREVLDELDLFGEEKPHADEHGEDVDV